MLDLASLLFPTMTWQGISGRQYSFVVHNVPVPAIPGPGVYIMVRPRTFLGGGVALYVGEAGDLSTRLVDTHEKWAAARSLGAAQVHILQLVSKDLAWRLAIETDLRQALKPPLNKQESRGLLTGLAGW